MILATDPSLSIEFTIPAVPVAMPRQRHRVMNIGGKHISQNYTPKNAPVQTFKATCRLAAQQAYQGAPLTGPLRMDVEFVFPRISGQIWKTKPMPRLRHAKKPDRDNCEKALMDALRELLFVDDAQVCAGEVQKWIASGDEQPHVKVLITPIF